MVKIYDVKDKEVGGIPKELVKDLETMIVRMNKRRGETILSMRKVEEFIEVTTDKKKYLFVEDEDIYKYVGEIPE